MRSFLFQLRHPYYAVRVRVHKWRFGHYPGTNTPSLSDWECVVCDRSRCTCGCQS